MKFSRLDIKREIGAGAFQRGLSYFNSRKVISLEIEADTEDYISIAGLVSGSNRTPYHVGVSIISEVDLFTRSPIQIEGVCSCPVEFNCKHVAALCLRYLASSQANQFGESIRFDWLDGIAKAETKLDPDAHNQFKFLIFYLSASASAGVLNLEAKESYYKKNSDLAKPKRISNSTIMYGSYLGDFLDHDQHTLQAMRALTIGYSQGCKIQDELGAYLLKRIVTAGHCFWQSFDNQPFSMGPSLTMELDWEKRADGSIQLRPLLAGSKATILLTDPVLYIDIPNRLVGEVVDTGYSFGQLKNILNAPVVKASAIADISRKLAVSYPELKIPKPVPVNIVQISAESLVPCLTLFRIQKDYRQFHALNLQFKYADLTLDMHPREAISSLTRGPDIFQIQRDLTAEMEKSKILVDLGFELVWQDQQPFFYSAANSLIESATRWHQFMETEVPKLKAAGWEISIDPSFAMSFESADDWFAGLEQSDNDWFELRFDLEIHGKKWPMVPLISQILQAYPIPEIPDTLAVPLGESEYVLLTWEQIEPVIQTLYELYNYDPSGEVFKISKYDAAHLAKLEIDHEQLQIKGAKKLLELGRKLQDFKGIKHLEAPQGLQTSLRAYQHAGFEWLQFLSEYELNGILADDMGLGKTVQVLAHLLFEKEQGRLQTPSLIIAPTTLMSNWRREVERFTPALSVLTLQGPERHARFETINDFDIVLSTYPLLSRDADQLLPQQWFTVVLDEAQMVKNPKAQASKVIRQLKAQHRLCLTGTPMENHLGELWSLFDFLMPGFLASEKIFNSHFRFPIEKNGDQWMSNQLARRVKPFLLRRTKDEVLQDLPSKSEFIRSVEMDEAQSKLYESIRISMEKRVRDAIAKNGLSRSHITILDALLKLRQVCCDPRLVKLPQAQKVKHSAKLALLMDMLPEMLEEGRKVLLFSQFTSMLALIEPELKNHGIAYSKLTGKTQNREQVVDAFKSGESNLFLISLKAGGLGLNLTEADTVIIYDPWWNPAVESQAADRTHRIGQDKPVFVYKLIIENSVEEKILALQEKKQILAKSIYSSGQSAADSMFSPDDISKLFEPLRPV